MLHHYVNRASRMDRRYLWLGAMGSQGVDAADIRLQVACDKDDYETAQAICEAAQAEFPEFFSYNLENPQRHIGYGHLICSWSVMRMWKAIADGTAIAGAWLDDYALRVPVQKVVNLCNQISPDILMLAWHRRDDVFIRDDYDLPVRYDVPDLLSISRLSPSVYQGACGGSDWANYLSPRGAGWLLQWMADMPIFNTELAIQSFALASHRQGIFSVRANDPTENGVQLLKRNRWVMQLWPYTDGAESDLVGLHEGGADD